MVTCPWNNAKVAAEQLEGMLYSRRQASKTFKPHLQGMVITEWSGWEKFRDEYYKKPEKYETGAESVKMLIEWLKKNERD